MTSPHDNGSPAGDARPSPFDPGPRLIALGASPDSARRLTEAHPAQDVTDALDAFEVFAEGHRVVDPVAWVTAAVTQRWDLTQVLARRREVEARNATWQRQQAARERSRDGYASRRSAVDAWDRAVSAALDDQQLGWATQAVTSAVPAIGRRSVPVARAELLAWAIEVHRRHPERPLADALADDLEAGAEPAVLGEGPLPAAPVLAGGEGDRPALRDRIADLLDRQPVVALDELEVAVPHRAVRFGADLELP